MNDVPSPPCSIEAEDAVIGHCLTWPENIANVDLRPEDFYKDRNKVVWAACLDLDRAERNVDIVTVNELLESRGQADIVGGVAGLIKYTSDRPIGINVEEYARIVKDRSERRRAIQIATELAKKAYDPREPFDRARVTAIDDLARDVSGTGEVVHISAVMSDLYDDLSERAENPQEIWGVPTGFADFDKITGGLQVGLTILAGDPGIGKTLWGVQAMSQAAERDYPGVVFELELGNMHLVRRLISAKSGVATRAMLSGRMEDADWPMIANAIDSSANLPIWLSDSTVWSTTSIRSTLRSFLQKHGIRWFLVDYMTLLTDNYGRNEIERTAYISRALRRVAKDLNLACLAIASQNKAGIGQEVKDLTAVSGAVQVVYDADRVLFLNKHLVSDERKRMGEKPQRNVRTMTFGKSRDGEGETERFVHFVVRTKGDSRLPAFADYAPDTERNNGHKRPIPF